MRGPEPRPPCLLLVVVVQFPVSKGLTGPASGGKLLAQVPPPPHTDPGALGLPGWVDSALFNGFTRPPGLMAKSSSSTGSHVF